MSSMAAQSADCTGNGTAVAANQGGGRKWVALCPRTELPLAGLEQQLHPNVSWGAVLLPAGSVLPWPCLLHQAVGQGGFRC